MPKVTIIVPMYNVDIYISNCILSLINQSYENIEIILVDDCSKDDTLKIANEFREKNPDKIKVIHNKKNFGTYISINIGIVNSNGKFITIIGSDDQFSKDKIEKQVDMLEHNENLVSCYCKYARYHYKTKKVTRKGYGESTIMFRRDIINRIGYYDSVRYGADTEYRDRIATIYGKKATGSINEILYMALYRPYSLTATAKSKEGSETRRIYQTSFMSWHKRGKNLYIPFPLKKRPFRIPRDLV